MRVVHELVYNTASPDYTETDSFSFLFFTGRYGGVFLLRIVRLPSLKRDGYVLSQRLLDGILPRLSYPCRTGRRAFLNRPQSASRWAETLEFWAEQKNGKDNNFQLVSHWVFSMSFKMTKVKLLFLYRFSVLSFICIISHSPAMAGA